jgi:Rieske Fe-S protein
LPSNDSPEKSSGSKFSRRDALKAAVIFGAVILFLPIERLAQYLIPPRETGPVTYPRLRIANTKDVPVSDSVLFEYPHKDRPAVLIHLPDGGFVAYDAVCTHLGCVVHYNKVAVAGWESNPRQVFSPCHGGVFEPSTGKVLDGPPPRPLPKIKLEIDEQGEIYANGYESGLPLYGES